MTGHVRARRQPGPASRAALQLLGCCPRVPTDVASQLLGSGHLGSTRQLLARLRVAGLVHVETVRPGTLLDGRTVRLWSLTATGRAALDGRGLAPSSATLQRLPYGAPPVLHDPGRQAVPLLVASFHALAALAATIHPRPRIQAWEQPWVRSVGPTREGRALHVRLPAAAVLKMGSSEPLRVLLLPDPGTAPVASYRPVLRRLLELREAARCQQEPLLVVVTADPGGAGARAEAWQSLLQQVARRAGEPPARTLILPWPRVVDDVSIGPRAPVAVRETRQLDQIVGLLARHPLLSRTQLAGLLGTSPARVAHLQGRLLGRGWLRPIDADELPAGMGGLAQAELRRLGLVEPTRAGRRDAAQRLLLSAPHAARHQGLIGGHAGARRRLLRQLAHTLGANAVFVALAQAAELVARCGGDDQLIEWRSAAACARGHCRPDGYGCYRRREARYGFLLEYDRGTERAHEYAAKLATYYRYRDSGAAACDYVGFPTVLVVTTAERAEALIAHQAHLAAEQRGGTPLPLLLTTTAHIHGHSEGIVGPIWRTPGQSGGTIPTRGYWLPGGPPRGLRKGGADGALRRHTSADVFL